MKQISTWDESNSTPLVHETAVFLLNMKDELSEWTSH